MEERSKGSEGVRGEGRRWEERRGERVTITSLESRA